MLFLFNEKLQIAIMRMGSEYRICNFAEDKITHASSLEDLKEKLGDKYAELVE